MGRRKEREKIMTRQNFLDHIKTTYLTDERIGDVLNELEHSDADGDFIFENELLVIGKYFYILDLKKPNGISEKLNFCIYGVGIKCNVTAFDYELETYENFEYVIIK